MKNFDSLYSRFLAPVLNSIFADTYIGGIFKIDNNRYFIEAVSRLTELRLRITEGRLNNNFPQLTRVEIAGEKLNFRVRAGATEPSTEGGRQLANIKAKGEFLERLSLSLPLNIAHRYNFDRAKVSSIVPKNLLAKKLFSWGSRRIATSLIYYSLFQGKKNTVTRKGKYQITTNGGAGHFSYHSAAPAGLLELIQRDAFLVYWLNSLAPRKIDVETYVSEKTTVNEREEFFALTLLLKELKKYHLQYYFLDITSDIPVPAVCCVVVSNSPTGKRLAIGASSGFETEKVLLTSVTEALSVLEANYFKEIFPLEESGKFSQNPIIGRSERLRLYLNDQHYEKFTFFLANEERVSVDQWSFVEDLTERSKAKDCLKYLKKVFAKKKQQNERYEVLVYEIKNKLLKAFDYRVVRVLCPALYPLYLNEEYRDLEHPRLKEFARFKKVENLVSPNIWPHPFP